MVLNLTPIALNDGFLTHTRWVTCVCFLSKTHPRPTISLRLSRVYLPPNGETAVVSVRVALTAAFLQKLTHQRGFALALGNNFSYYTFPDGEPFVAFGVSFRPLVKPEGMLNLETLLGLGGTLLFQPF